MTVSIPGETLCLAHVKRCVCMCVHISILSSSVLLLRDAEKTLAKLSVSLVFKLVRLSMCDLWCISYVIIMLIYSANS